MIHPSYNELLKTLNEVRDENEPEIDSRYSLVIASAKRARQIVNGQEPLADHVSTYKPLSIAVEELEQEQLKILPQDEEEVLSYEEADRAAARALENSLTEEALRESEANVLGEAAEEQDVTEEDEEN